MAVSSGVTKLQKEGELMSTSLLYHGWGLRGYEYRASGFQHGEVCFRVGTEARHVPLLQLRLSTLLDPDLLAQEIVEDLEDALEQFRSMQRR